ncbi:RNA polymerase sigma factor [Conyzicola sp.]|uniref:RNA polymerase sigma factor n=1 Tax=Conyzicola sp. TaxID=1969404 RepID=UPI003989F13C
MTTDTDIVQRARDRPADFGELFERHSPTLLRYVRRRIGPDAAADVISETFLIAFKKRATFDTSRDSALPWLFGIATRELKRHIGDEYRVLRAVAASPLDHIAADVIEELTDRLDAASRVALLGTALANLPRRDRDTLLLYAWGDLTYEGVAEAMGTNLGTVKSRINRARTRLQNTITSHLSTTSDPKGDLSWTT